MIENDVNNETTQLYHFGLKKLSKRKETLGDNFFDITLCSDCQCNIIKGEEFYDKDGRVICQECFDSQYAFCHECGEIIDILNSNLLDHEVLCGSCYHDKIYHCYECDEAMENIDEVYKSPEGDVLCEQCFFNIYDYCDECGECFEKEELNSNNICPICSPKLLKTKCKVKIDKIKENM